MAEYEYQLKFVVDNIEDLDAVRGYMAEFPEIDREGVLLDAAGNGSGAAGSPGCLVKAVLRVGRPCVLPAEADRMVRRGEGDLSGKERRKI